MLDFFEKDGKIYWSSEITKEKMLEEKAKIESNIKENKKQIEYIKSEIERLAFENWDYENTLLNIEKFLKEAKAGA